MKEIKYKPKKNERTDVSSISYDVINSMGDGLVLLSIEGKYIFVNQAFEKITGYKNTELLGKDAKDTVKKLIASQDTENAAEILNTVLSGEIPAPEVLTIISKNGKKIPITFTISFIKDSIGKPSIVVMTVKDVAKQHESEKKLRESEQLFRSLAENIREVFYVHDGALKKLLYVSPIYEQIWGRSCQSLYRNPADWINAIHSDDKKHVSEAWRDIIKIGKFSEEYRIVRANGSIRWVWDRAVPIYSSSGKVMRIVGTAEDVTERKQTEEDLRKFSQAVEQSASMVEVTDREGNIEYVNPKFVRITGYTRYEVIGKNSSILKSGETPQEEYKKLWEAITSGREWRGEFHNKKKNGELYWESASISPVKNKEGKITHFVAVKEDITERKKAEERLRKQNEELVKNALEINELKGLFEDKNVELELAVKYLNKQNKDLVKKTMALTELQGQIEDKNFELEQANREILKLSEERVDFINKSAHDLRTPITPILVLIPTIKKRIKDKDILKDIEVIERNANYLKRIANNLISYLKSKTGNYNYVFRKKDIRKIIEEVLATYEESFHQKNTYLIKKIPKNLPLVEIDDLKIKEVIQNIVSNALKFTSKKGLGLIITAKKIDNFINIKFRDTGIGMSKKTLSKLFEEFFKADVSRHSTGEGLGLAICKEIIERHNGSIRAESKGFGKGTTISFDVPISQKVIADEK